MVKISSRTIDRIFIGISVLAVVANWTLFDYNYRIKPRIHENLYRRVVQTADTNGDGTTTIIEERDVYNWLRLNFDKRADPLFYLTDEQMRDYLKSHKNGKTIL